MPKQRASSKAGSEKSWKQKSNRRKKKSPLCWKNCLKSLKEDGYPDVRAFMATYRKAEAVVEQYNRDLAEWERQVREKAQAAQKEHCPPEKESVRDRLRQLQAEGKTQRTRNANPTTEKDNFDIEHDTAGQNPCLAGLHISLKYLSNFTRKPSCQFVPDRRDCCKCTYHTYMNLFRSFLLTVNSCSDYACSAHKEKCKPQCHMAVVAGLRRLRIVISGLRRICIVIYY